MSSSLAAVLNRPPRGDGSMEDEGGDGEEEEEGDGESPLLGRLIMWTSPSMFRCVMGVWGVGCVMGVWCVLGGVMGVMGGVMGVMGVCGVMGVRCCVVRWVVCDLCGGTSCSCLRVWAGLESGMWGEGRTGAGSCLSPLCRYAR